MALDLAEKVCCYTKAIRLTLMGRAASDEKGAEWRKKAETAARQLNDLRRELRLALWGVDSALYVLSRTPMYVAHVKGNPKHVEVAIAAATRLRRSVDVAARDAFLYGRPPSLWRRLDTWRAARRVTAAFKDARPEVGDPEGRLGRGQEEEAS